MVSREIDMLTHIGGKARPPDKDGQRYMPVVLESYQLTKSGKGHDLHVRPIAGQGKFKTDMDVECGRDMRRKHPAGTKFLAWCIIKNREGAEHVFTSHRWHNPVYDENKRILNRRYE